jgi:hypothetical protein
LEGKDQIDLLPDHVEYKSMICDWLQAMKSFHGSSLNKELEVTVDNNLVAFRNYFKDRKVVL